MDTFKVKVYVSVGGRGTEDEVLENLGEEVCVEGMTLTGNLCICGRKIGHEKKKDCDIKSVENSGTQRSTINDKAYLYCEMDVPLKQDECGRYLGLANQITYHIDDFLYDFYMARIGMHTGYKYDKVYNNKVTKEITNRYAVSSFGVFKETTNPENAITQQNAGFVKTQLGISDK